MTFPMDAAHRLGACAGLRYTGDNHIFKSEAEDDFASLPVEVQEAFTIIGRLVDDEPVPVAKAEPTFPHTAADGAKAKAAAGVAVKEPESKPLKPGEGRAIATAKLTTMVSAYRKENPTVTEARAWAAVLDTKEGARWYNLGEIGEQEARRK